MHENLKKWTVTMLVYCIAISFLFKKPYVNIMDPNLMYRLVLDFINSIKSNSIKRKCSRPNNENKNNKENSNIGNPKKWKNMFSEQKLQVQSSPTECKRWKK